MVANLDHLQAVLIARGNEILNNMLHVEKDTAKCLLFEAVTYILIIQVGSLALIVCLMMRRAC